MTKRIAVNGYMIRIRNVNCIFIIKDRIEVFNDDMMRICNFDHISLEDLTVHPATVPVKDNAPINIFKPVKPVLLFLF
jgi:hypothetical protein